MYQETHDQRFASILSHQKSPNIEQNSFPCYKTKLLKSARKHVEDSLNSSFTNNLNTYHEKDEKNFEYKQLPTNMNSEKSNDHTPSKESNANNFSESLKSPKELSMKPKISENDSNVENLQSSIKELKAQNQKYQKEIEEKQLNEKKLKEFVASLLDVNSKLTIKIKEKDIKKENRFQLQMTNEENILANKSDFGNNESKSYYEKIEKQLKDTNDERDYLSEKIISLNQRLEAMIKKDLYKEKMLDFYKNRIKLYQFKLENYPKSEKDQIKYLEDYIMALLGENSKLNKALEKSDYESKKWQEKYFDFEKAKEVLITMESNSKDKINEIANKTYNPNNIHEKEMGNSASKKDYALYWGCKPNN